MESRLREIDSNKDFALNVFNLDKIKAVDDFYKTYSTIVQFYQINAKSVSGALDAEDLDNLLRKNIMKICDQVINQHRLIFDAGPESLYASIQGFDEFCASRFCLSSSLPLDDYDTFSVFLEELQYAITKELYYKSPKSAKNRSFVDYIYFIDRFIARFIKKYTPKIEPEKEKLYVFKKIGAVKCHKENHFIVPRIYYAWGIKEKAIVPLPAHYCVECKKYYIGEATYNMYVENHGQLVVEKYQYENCDFDSVFSKFNPETPLHCYGYDVSVNGPSKKERRELLVYLIKSGRMKYEEICRTIENNIYIFEGKERFDRALEKWRSDLKYLGDLVIKGKITR